jgi:hypothetical protein
MIFVRKLREEATCAAISEIVQEARMGIIEEKSRAVREREEIERKFREEEKAKA